MYILIGLIGTIINLFILTDIIIAYPKPLAFGLLICCALAPIRFIINELKPIFNNKLKPVIINFYNNYNMFIIIVSLIGLISILISFKLRMELPAKIFIISCILDIWLLIVAIYLDAGDIFKTWLLWLFICIFIGFFALVATDYNITTTKYIPKHIYKDINKIIVIGNDHIFESYSINDYNNPNIKICKTESYNAFHLKNMDYWNICKN